VVSKTLRKTGRRRIQGILSVALLGTTLGLASPGEAQEQSGPRGQGTQQRSGHNYRLGNDENPLRGKVAPGLAVNPNNPDHIVETHLDLLNAVCEHNVSTDGGATWTGDVFTPPPGYPTDSACTVVGHGANASAGSVEFGSGQTVYAAWASAKEGHRSSALVSKSTDGGATYPVVTEALVGMPTSTSGSRDFGFPNLTVVPGGGTNGADKVVVASGNAEQTPGHGVTGTAVVTVSNDGGATWSAPVTVNPPPNVDNPFAAVEVTQPVVGPEGAIYVAWRTAPAPAPGQTIDQPAGFIRVGKSTDDGATWTFTDATNVRGEGNFTASSFPRLAIDETSGTLYLVWNQNGGLYQDGFQAQDHFMNKLAQVWFMRSTDGNATWTDRIQISDSPSGQPPTEAQTRRPNIDVTPTGRVDIVWHDRRHSYRNCLDTHRPCAETRLGDTYYVFSADQGVSFSSDRRITDRSLNNDVGFDYRFSTYWNFGPVSVPLGTDGVLFAWMDSREGSFDTDTQDIYLAKLAHNAPTTPIPTTSLASAGASDLSVALSQLAYPGGSEAILASTFATRPGTRVVIANDGDVARTLAGGVLARANLGPVLLSPAGGLPASVQDEVSRLFPVGAFLLGDTTALSPQIEADLIDLGIPSDQIVRFGGANPAETASLIATSQGCPLPSTQAGPQPPPPPGCIDGGLDRRTATDRVAGTPAFDAVVVANPNSPDSAAVATLAANRRLPVLYVDSNAIPPATSAALAALNIDKTLVVGGADDVSGSVVAQLPNATRLGGGDAYATSTAVLQESIARGLPRNQVFVADGNKPLHGALLGSSAGRIGGLQMLTPGANTRSVTSVLDQVGLRTELDRFVRTVLTDPPAGRGRR
jgi:putative cell wall-binding protein